MRSVWMIAVLAACSDAKRGGMDLVGGDDDTGEPTGDDSGEPNDDTSGNTNDDSGKTDDSGDSGDSGKTGGTVDTAGDCPVTIPKDVLVIDDDAYVKDDGIVVYVCKNKVLSLVGGSATVFVGVGGQLWNNSSGNTIYAKAGAELAFYDSDNEVYVEDGVSVEDDSKDGTLPLVICTSVTYENEPDC